MSNIVITSQARDRACHFACLWGNDNLDMYMRPGYLDVKKRAQRSDAVCAHNAVLPRGKTAV